MARHVSRAGGLPEYGPPPTSSAESGDDPGATPTTQANCPHIHDRVGSPLRQHGAMSTHRTQHSRPFTPKDADEEGEDSWVHLLPEADVHTFTAELVDAVWAADSADNSASVTQTLIAWQHTAEVYSNPELLAALTRDHSEDHGPAPHPRGIA